MRHAKLILQPIEKIPLHALQADSLRCRAKVKSYQLFLKHCLQHHNAGQEIKATRKTSRLHLVYYLSSTSHLISDHIISKDQRLHREPELTVVPLASALQWCYTRAQASQCIYILRLNNSLWDDTTPPLIPSLLCPCWKALSAGPYPDKILWGSHVLCVDLVNRAECK